MHIFTYGRLNVYYKDGNVWEINQVPPEAFGLMYGEYNIIPADGFITDFLSIPVFARWLIPKTGGNDRSGVAAIFHDWLYSYPGINRTPASRKFADDLFRDVLIHLGVKRWKYNLMYAAVRVGGGRVYGKPSKLNRMRGID